MKPFAIFLFIALVGLSFLGLIFHAIGAEQQQFNQREREWMEFSQRNHCHIVRDDSFWNDQTLWQCDGGFQVRMLP